MINFNDKKAGERVLSFYWMIVFVLITIAVVSAAVLFYGSPLDVREVEARILSDKILECISNNGNLNNAAISSLNEDGSNLEAVCKLNFADSGYSENQYYAEINIENGKSISFNKQNSGAFKNFCDSDDRNLPICHSEIIFLLDGNNLRKVSLLTSISKIKQNARL